MANDTSPGRRRRDSAPFASIPKATFSLSEATQERLKAFAQRTGISQSALVEQMLNHGLAYLEERYAGTGPILDDAYAGRGVGGPFVPKGFRPRLRAKAQQA